MYEYEVPYQIEKKTIEPEDYLQVATQLTEKLRDSNQEIVPGVKKSDLAEVSGIFFQKVIPRLLNGKLNEMSLFLRDGIYEYVVPAKKDSSILSNSEVQEEQSEGQISDVIPTLNITNPERFLLHIYELQKLFDEKKDQLQWLTYLSSQSHEVKQMGFDDFMYYIWFDATAADFNNPERFLQEIEGTLQDESFDYFERPREIGELSSIQNKQKHLMIQKDQARGQYETPFVFNIALADGANKMDGFNIPGALPSVRYARDSKEHAKIYALQSPKLRLVKEEEIEQRKEWLEDEMASDMKFFKQDAEKYKDLWQQYMHIDISILESEDDPEVFCKKLIEAVKANTTYFSDKAAFYKQFDDMPETHHNFYLTIASRLYFLTQLEKNELEYKQAKDRPRDRAEIRNELRRELNRGIKEWDFKNIEAPGLVSALSAIALFKNDGVRKITIPLHLPERWQQHASKSDDIAKGNWGKTAEEIEETTTDKLALTMVRLADQVKGIKIVSYPDETGNLELEFTEDPLESDYPILQDVISAVSKIYKR